MKKKIVLWGNDENEKKILVALELKAEDNQVNVYTFAEELATEEFYNLMMNDWRMGKEVAFPDGHTVSSNPLSLTDDLLPENIKVIRTDVISRAKAEWHFVVLSEKLYDMYKTELEDIKEKVDQLVDFDGGLWDEMKEFWSKINEQIRERNLFREQANKLKDQTNALFNQLKELRNKANEQFSEVSKQRFDVYKAKLDEIEQKVEKGLGLNPIFNELKKIQSEFRDEKMTRGDSNRLWKNIDVLFKKVKEKKFGKPAEGSNNNASRLERRYNGLMGAIDKMQRSIDRDKKDIDFQKRRVNETDGQLEMQIRQAKVKMIEERIASKEEKLNEMLGTKKELESKVEKEKERAQVREEKKEIQKKKKEVKEKIAAEIAEKSKEVDDEKMKKAASKLKPDAEADKKVESVEAKEEAPKKEEPKEEAPKKEESLLGAIATVAGEALENVVDTVKAVGEVVGDKIEDKLEDVKEKVEDIKTDIQEKVAIEQSESSESDDEGSLLKKGGILATAAAAGGLLVDKMKDKAAETKEAVESKISDIKESVTESTDLNPDETIDEVASRMSGEEE